MHVHFVHRLERAGSAALLALLLAALGCASAAGPSPTASESAGQESSTERRTQAHYKLGVEHLRQGQPALAIRELRAATEYDPSDVWVRLALAEAYRMKGHLDLAESELNTALRLRPDFQQARLNLSALYIQMERYEEAVAQTRALLEDPTFPVPWKALTNQGFAEYKLGRLREARQSLELAVEYHGEYWQALLNLGILDADEGRRLEALERFDAVLALRPGPLAESEVNYRIGEIYVALGNRERAVQHLTAAASNRPSGEWGRRSEDYLKRLR
jgi:Tfp pilus assembly protein PilF